MKPELWGPVLGLWSLVLGLVGSVLVDEPWPWMAAVVLGGGAVGLSRGSTVPGEEVERDTDRGVGPFWRWDFVDTFRGGVPLGAALGLVRVPMVLLLGFVVFLVLHGVLAPAS